MNKQTLSFIWGLIMFFVCTAGVVSHLIMVIEGEQTYFFNWFFFMFSAIGSFMGFTRIYKAID